MIIAFFKFVIYWVLRPVALYRIYPASLAFLVGPQLAELPQQEQELIEKGGEPLVLLTEDNRKLEGMYFSAEHTHPETISFFPDQERPTVIFCLGNNMFFQSSWPHFEYYLSHGMNVLTFNYGGYGHSEGSPSTESTFKDVEAAYKYVKDVTLTDDEHILVHGVSLGGGPASYLGSRYPIHVVLDRTYASIGQVSDFKVLAALGDHFYPYLNAQRTKELKGRVHLVEASDDEMMRPKHMEQIFSSILDSRHPLVSDEERMDLKEHYITKVPGKHSCSVLLDKEENQNAREHFYQEVVLPFFQKRA